MVMGENVTIALLFVVNFIMQLAIIYIFWLLTEDPAYDEDTFAAMKFARLRSQDYAVSPLLPNVNLATR